MREEEENKSYIICSSCDVPIVLGTLLSAIKRIELKTALLGRPPGKLSSLFFISLHENMALPATMLPVESIHLWCSKILEYYYPVLDQRLKFYGRSRRFKTYSYGYGGRSLRPFLRPKILVVVFLVFFTKWRLKSKLSCVFITQVPPVFRLH